MHRKYQHIFFDLDRTLWDFEASSHATFKELFIDFSLAGQISSLDDFLAHYHKHNYRLWEEYKKGHVSKEILRQKRFWLTLKDFGIKDQALSQALNREYIRRCPRKNILLPGALETLEYLRQHYQLHILTNGFEETQYIKMEKCGLNPFFKEVITSDSIGMQKPDKRIFIHALKKTGASFLNSIMVGDDLDADIRGALESGIDQVYLNPGEKTHQLSITYEIKQLIEMKTLL